MTNLKQKPPFWFWVVSVIALLWNLMGVDQYIGQAYKTDRWKASMTSEQIELASTLPSWLTAAFAIAVFTAAIGSMGLLLRKKASYSLLVISLIAVVIQMGYFLINGYTDHIGMTISIIAFAVFLVWFAKKSISKHWIV
ncbi:hypothetical protein [Aestuariibaculum lutulentum]|uniref:Sugar transporter n=1 Tax=Aestuariibaculum lutulentum TaxID=2920935 RepID=A0ABS9RLG6_9FLAO|nr:hypothetical protein [Aestuariibaculum lutulentum]MCH4553799.1 hypothetical protein [Aestuariibaculum lutulentum]